jgi:predicted nuclease of predicted toxin-antitoxin system
VKFLVDNALSPKLAAGLNAHGHDATHVRDRGLSSVPDEAVLALAAAEDRIVVSSDTDFGTLLAASHRRRPSVVLFRRGAPQRAGDQLALLLANVPQLRSALEQGSVVIFAGSQLRIRTLPIGGEPNDSSG